MSDTGCPYEEKVGEAARSGTWSAELVAHRDGCMTCAELTLVTAALADDAEVLMDDSLTLPDPALIWMRAQLARREHDFKRATRAIVWVQRATIAVVMAVGLAFAPGFWGLLKSALSGLDFNLGASISELPRAAGSPVLVMIVSMLVLGGLALWELTVAQEN
jgi:hypothetical protein